VESLRSLQAARWSYTEGRSDPRGAVKPVKTGIHDKGRGQGWPDVTWTAPPRSSARGGQQDKGDSVDQRGARRPACDRPARSSARWSSLGGPCGETLGAWQPEAPRSRDAVRGAWRAALHLEIFGTAESSSSSAAASQPLCAPQWPSIGPRDSCQGLFQGPLRLQHACSSLLCVAMLLTRRRPAACRTRSANSSPRPR